MKNFKKIVLLFLLLPIMAQAELGTEYELSTDDRENIAVLNTLGAVNILGLSGYYSVGRDIECFKIISIPDPSEGILYLGDGETEVEVGQILSIDEANGLKFDPNPDFVGDAKFQYASINSNEEVDPNPATVTIPVYGKDTDTNGTTTSTSTDTNGTTASTSTDTNGTTISTSTDVNGTSVTSRESCKEYSSTPSLSLWGIIIMMILILVITREELNQDF